VIFAQRPQKSGIQLALVASTRTNGSSFACCWMKHPEDLDLKMNWMAYMDNRRTRD